MVSMLSRSNLACALAITIVVSLVRGGSGSNDDMSDKLLGALGDSSKNAADLVVAIAHNNKFSIEKGMKVVMPWVTTTLGMINPFIGIVLNFGFSLISGLFGSPADDFAKMLQKQFQRLRESIMTEVRDFVSNEFLKRARINAKDKMTQLLNEVRISRPLTVSKIDSVLTGLAMLKNDVFSSACLAHDMGDECLQWRRSGSWAVEYLYTNLYFQLVLEKVRLHTTRSENISMEASERLGHALLLVGMVNKSFNEAMRYRASQVIPSCHWCQKTVQSKYYKMGRHWYGDTFTFSSLCYVGAGYDPIRKVSVADSCSISYSGGAWESGDRSFPSVKWTGGRSIKTYFDKYTVLYTNNKQPRDHVYMGPVDTQGCVTLVRQCHTAYFGENVWPQEQNWSSRIISLSNMIRSVISVRDGSPKHLSMFSRYSFHAKGSCPGRHARFQSSSGEFLDCQRVCSEDPRCAFFSWAPEVAQGNAHFTNWMKHTRTIWHWNRGNPQYDPDQTSTAQSGSRPRSCRTFGKISTSSAGFPEAVPGEVCYRKILQNQTYQPLVPVGGKVLYTRAVSVRRRASSRRRSCVSCSLKVRRSSGEHVQVSDLQLGDMIEGIDSQQLISNWCRVIFANKTGFGTLRGNFTESHWLINEELGELEANVSNSSTHQGELCEVVTDCPAVRVQDGSLFTPYSTDFCNKSLGWKEVVKLHAIVLSVVAETGHFWFDPRNYHHNDSNALAPFGWMDQLPALCRTLLDCGTLLNPSPACEEFNRRFSTFVGSNLDEQFRPFVFAAFPDMHVARVVQELEEHRSVLLVWLGCVGLLIFATLAIVWRRIGNCMGRQPKQSKEAPETEWGNIMIN